MKLESQCINEVRESRLVHFFITTSLRVKLRKTTTETGKTRVDGVPGIYGSTLIKNSLAGGRRFFSGGGEGCVRLYSPKITIYSVHPRLGGRGCQATFIWCLMVVYYLKLHII